MVIEYCHKLPMLVRISMLRTNTLLKDSLHTTFIYSVSSLMQVKIIIVGF